MPDVQGTEDHQDGPEGDARGWRRLLLRAALLARALVVGQHPLGGDDAEVVGEVGAEEDCAVGMKPYSRSDAEALRVLEAVLTGGNHEGCGQHVEYWLAREWACLIWRHDGRGIGKLRLRITNLGKREVGVWVNRKARA